MTDPVSRQQEWTCGVPGCTDCRPCEGCGTSIRNGRYCSVSCQQARLPDWNCPACGCGRWVAASLTGPVEYGGTAIKQCVKCGRYTDEPVDRQEAELGGCDVCDQAAVHVSDDHALCEDHACTEEGLRANATPGTGKPDIGLRQQDDLQACSCSGIICDPCLDTYRDMGAADERARIDALLDAVYETWKPRHPCSGETAWHVRNYMHDLSHAIRQGE